MVDGKAKAYATESVKKAGRVEDIFEGKTILLEYQKDIDAVRMFEKKSDPSGPSGEDLERINPFGAFWFSWAAVHPQTELYK